MSSSHNSSRTLADTAADLKALANDLAQGNLRIGTQLIAIGNPESIKIKQKITGDTASFTFFFQAPIQNTNLKTHSQESSKNENGQGTRLHGRPPEGKKIKKDLAVLWKAVAKKLAQGQTPTPAEAKSLVSTLASYTVFSESAWQEDWHTCCTNMQTTLAYAQKGDLRKALEYAEKVNELARACHQKHK